MQNETLITLEANLHLYLLAGSLFLPRSCATCDHSMRSGSLVRCRLSWARVTDDMVCPQWHLCPKIERAAQIAGRPAHVIDVQVS